MHFSLLVYRQSIEQRNICVLNFCDQPKILENAKIKLTQKMSCSTVVAKSSHCSYPGCISHHNQLLLQLLYFSITQNRYSLGHNKYYNYSACCSSNPQRGC